MSVADNATFDANGNRIGTQDAGFATPEDLGGSGRHIAMFSAQAAAMRRYTQEAEKRRLARHLEREKMFKGDPVLDMPPEYTSNGLAGNSALRKDEWIQLDDRLYEIAERELRAVEDLRAAGLTIDTDLSTLTYEWETQDNFGDPEIDMGAEARGRDEEVSFTLHGVPLPIVHKSWHINFRKLGASRTRGAPLDVTLLAQATRSVSEGLEDMLFNGWDSQFAGREVHGYRTYPDRNTFTGEDWTDRDPDTGTTHFEIRDDIIDMIEEMEEDNKFPGNTGYWLYLAREQYQELRRRDTGTSRERGLFQRLREEFGGEVDFRRADYLPNGEAVMLHPTDETVELAVASDFQNVEWSSHQDFTTHMKVMASMTPVLKSDDAGQCGIVHVDGLSG